MAQVRDEVLGSINPADPGGDLRHPVVAARDDPVPLPDHPVDMGAQVECDVLLESIPVALLAWVKISSGSPSSRYDCGSR